MSKKNKCIFYLPYKLEENGKSARMIRPKKIINALNSLGYEVFVIQGYSSERKKLISELKRRIRNGETFRFAYSESSTEPTLLTNPNHLPTHPLMDFEIFAFLKKNSIPIGLFYCDIYWAFDGYGEGLSIIKKKFAIMNYKYDIYKYSKLLNTLYLPSKKMARLLNSKKLMGISKELPPGTEDITLEAKDYQNRRCNSEPLKIFYVGGLGGHYSISKLVQAVSELQHCQLTICCREKEYKKEKRSFEKFINDRIRIVHKSGTALEELLKDADLGSLIFEKSEYRDLAQPIKAYEYFSYELPVLSTRNTAIGEIVESKSLGRTMEYNVEEIKKSISYIMQNPQALETYKRNVRLFKEQNLWICRAKQIEKDLTESLEEKNER